MDPEQIAQILADCGWTWRLKDGTMVQPTADDVEKVVESAVAYLKAEEGDQVEIGRLLIRKTPTSFQVFVMTGEFA